MFRLKFIQYFSVCGYDISLCFSFEKVATRFILIGVHFQLLKAQKCLLVPIYHCTVLSVLLKLIIYVLCHVCEKRFLGETYVSLKCT